MAETSALMTIVVKEIVNLFGGRIWEALRLEFELIRRGICTPSCPHVNSTTLLVCHGDYIDLQTTLRSTFAHDR